MLPQTCMTVFLMWNIEEDILKNVSVFFFFVEVKGNKNCLVTNILQNIVVFCVPQNN